MEHVVTVRDIVHWSLMGCFIATLIGVAWWWLALFAAGMSDSPTAPPSLFGAIFVHVIPMALFIAWWCT